MPVLTDAEARAYVLERFPGTEFHGEYPGTKVKWSMTCPEGHSCAPRLGGVLSGQGICVRCGKRAAARKMVMSGDAAKALVLAIDPDVEFLAEYVNNKTPWAMKCGKGHNCSPRLDSVLSGQGICRPCGYVTVSVKLTRTQEEAKRLILDRFPETVFLEDYVDGNTPWRMICPSGHVTAPRLESVAQGVGICSRCAGNYSHTPPEALEILASLNLGVTPQTEYPGYEQPWHMVCSAGHNCSPRLHSLLQGQGPCWRCGLASGADKRRYTEEQALGILMARFEGAQPLAPYPLSVSEPWEMLCPAGHRASPRLSGILSGQGICRSCSPGGYDPNKPGWFYVLQATIGEESINQFGISNVPQDRLLAHRNSGFVEFPVALLYSDDGEAIASLERAVKAHVKRAGLTHCHALGMRFSGATESLPDSVLPLANLLELVDKYSSPSIGVAATL